MDADEQGLESGEYQSQDGDASVPSDSEDAAREPTATLDLPAGPASPSESSSNSSDDGDDVYEKQDSSQWRSESIQQRGPRTPSPPRGPRTPSPRGPRTPSPPPHEGPRTPSSPRSRTSSPEVRTKGPQTPPSSPAPDDGAGIEDTPASPIESPLDSDEEDVVPEQGRSELQADEFEHKFATDDTPFSPIESSDSNTDVSNDELSIMQSVINKTIEGSDINVRPPSPPMLPPDSRSQSPYSPGMEQGDDYSEQDTRIRPPSPPVADSTDTNQSLKSLSQTSESAAAEEVESMEQDGVRDRPPSPPSPSESQGSEREDMSANGNTNEEEGFARYLYRPPSPTGNGRRSPPPQVSIDTMDGLEFGSYQQKQSPFQSEPPSVLASRTQSPFHGNEPSSSGNSSNISERLMATIRIKTESVHIVDSNSQLGESDLMGTASRGSPATATEQPIENTDKQIDSEQSFEQQSGKSHRTGSDDEGSDSIENKQSDQIHDVEPKQDDQSVDVLDKDSAKIDTDVNDVQKEISHKDESDDLNAASTTASSNPDDSTRPTLDIALHPANRDLDLEEPKDKLPPSTEKRTETKETVESLSTAEKSDPPPAEGAAAVVDVHIDVHGDELDYEEDVEDHVGKDGGKEEGEEDDEEGAIDDDHDEGEITDDEEEGEVKEPGDKRPSVRPTCRFFAKGQCTWGSNCRFIHPGFNDKGAYQFIDRQEFHEATAKLLAPPPPPVVEEPEPEPEPEPFPPPPPDNEPKTETAWERGLRHAKELRKKASMKREQDRDFEEKRMLADDLDFEQADYNKENNYRNSRGDNMETGGSYGQEYYGYAMPVEDDFAPIFFPESRNCYPGGQSPPPLDDPMPTNRRDSYPSPPPVRMPMEYGRDKFGRDRHLAERDRLRRQRDQREREVERQKEHVREIRRERERQHHSPPPRPVRGSWRGRDDHRGGRGRMEDRGRDRMPPRNHGPPGDRGPPGGGQQPGMPPSSNSGRQPADTWSDPWARNREKPKQTTSKSTTRGRRRRRSGSYSDDSLSDS